MFVRRPADLFSTSKRKLSYGVGLNDADYKTSFLDKNGKHQKCPIYKKWLSVLTRCYSESLKKRQPTYRDCTVCEEWLTFSKFKSWVESQDWQGKHLDKDILIQGNKHYSPETCLFVSSEVNNLILDRKAARGECKQGVSLNKVLGKYKARCKVNGKDKHLGYYDTEQEAFEVYREFKYSVIKKVANTQQDLIRKALLNYVIV
jgi:hypothetical protein